MESQHVCLSLIINLLTKFGRKLCVCVCCILNGIVLMCTGADSAWGEVHSAPEQWEQMGREGCAWT